MKSLQDHSQKFISSALLWPFTRQGTVRLFCILFSWLGKTSATPRLVIEDREQQKRIISSIHNECHLGMNRTNELVAKKYYWPGLYKDVNVYVSSYSMCLCIACAQQKNFVYHTITTPFICALVTLRCFQLGKLSCFPHPIGYKPKEIHALPTTWSRSVLFLSNARDVGWHGMLWLLWRMVSP